MIPSVYQLALSLIETHGSKVAWQHAMIRAMEQADVTGISTWACVVDAIDELTRTTRQADEALQ